MSTQNQFSRPRGGCHFLLQCMKVKSEREVAQSCPTFSDPVDCSPPGSCVHGVFQARVLEWGAIAFSVWVVSVWEMPYRECTGLPWWLGGKEFTCQCRRCRFNPWVGKIPWRRKWQPTPVFLSVEAYGQRSLGGLQSMESQRVEHNSATKQHAEDSAEGMNEGIYIERR